MGHHQGIHRRTLTWSTLCSLIACGPPPMVSNGEVLAEAGPNQREVVAILNVSAADSIGGQPRSWFAMVESRDDKGKSRRLQVFISPRAKAKDSQGNPIPLPGIEAGDRVKFWLKDIMRLSEPAQAFADSLQVVTRGR